jgi:hypothetical protein
MPPMIAVILHLSKNQPRFPEAASHTAQVYIRPAAIVFHIVAESLSLGAEMS